MTPGTPLVCAHDRLTRPLLPALGGKGQGLARLTALGHAVPPWYAITTAAFSTALASGALPASIAARLAALPDSPAALRAAADDIRSWILAAALPPDLTAAVAAAHAACLPADAAVAVRSSAADEDGATASHAGLYDSVLGVCGVAGVLAALATVWASAWSDRALAYRRARGLPLAPKAMAVVVQQMVAARTSGVVFTADPATGDVRQVVVSALYGCGEGLVDGSLPADRYRIAKAALGNPAARSGQGIRQAAGHTAGQATSPTAGQATATGSALHVEIAVKEEQLLPGGDGPGLVRRPVAPELQRLPCLTPEQVLRLARLGVAVESQLKRPQDLEFAFDAADRLLLLQARPLTGLAEYGPAAGQRIVWDHENWAENYPGVTLPLTYSVTRRQERVGYRSLAAMMRMDAERLFEYQVAYDQPLGYIRGRLVTNEINRYRLMGLIRGLDFDRRGLLGLLRFPVDELDPDPAPAPPPLRRYLVELPKLLSLFAGLAGDFLHVHRDVGALLDAARSFHARCAAMDFDAMEPHELLAVYSEVEVRLVAKWKAPLLNVLFLRMLYVLQKRLCRTWCGDTTGALQNDLLRGDRGSESARPLKLLLELACDVHRDPALGRLFALHPPEELARIVAADPAHAAFAAKVASYLDTYHYQSVYEMKLDSDTLRDRPDLLYRKIRDYVAQGDLASLDPEVRRAQEERTRLDAERRAEAGLRARFSLLPRT
jgi:hypothetical protein